MLVIFKLVFEERLYYLASLMEEESPSHYESDNILTDAELLQLITACRLINKEEAAEASHILLMHLRPSLVSRLF
jgi:hypothetical protein